MIRPLSEQGLQGVVDGAENTELALTVDGHEDLVKSYTYTEHQFSPDIFMAIQTFCYAY